MPAFGLLAACFLLTAPGPRQAATPAPAGPRLEIAARSAPKWTGVAVSRTGRIFVNFPRWEDIPYSVAEIVDGRTVPYPDAAWNSWAPGRPPAEAFVCVQSVVVDRSDDLWVLDPGASVTEGVIPGAPKLLRFDLKTNRIVQVVRFDGAAAPRDSYLNDVRIDRDTGAAYITDSGRGALVVVDLATGRSRRVLEGHVSTTAEKRPLRVAGRSFDFPVHADGLALSNDAAFLYYKPLTARALYRIPARALRDPALPPARLAEAVEFVAETMPCDGLEFDARGRLIITAIEENALYRLAPGGRPEKLVSDDRLAWPDSVAVTASGDIFVTASRIQFPPAEHLLFRIRMTPAVR